MAAQAQAPDSTYRAQIVARRRQQLVSLVAGLQLLPTTVAVPMRILHLQRSGTAGMNDFAEALLADTGLATKILQLANSAALARRRKVTRLTDAVATIGLKNLLSLVFGVSIAGIFHRLSAPSDLKDGLWKASLLKATVAREYARLHAPQFAEESFLCGMIQDLSIPVILGADASARPEVLSILELEAALRKERELAMHGVDHGTLGRIICAKLGLPQLYQLATGAHHDGLASLKRAMRGVAGPGAVVTTSAAAPADAGEPVLSEAVVERLAEACELAAALPHRAGTPPKIAAQRLAAHFATSRSAAGAPGVPEQDLRPVLTAAHERYAEMLAMLGEHADESGVAFKQFIQSLGTEITRCVEQAIAESATVITTLETDKAGLESEIGSLKQQALQSDYDSLTKVLNRRGFVARAGRLFRLAREHNAPVVLGFADLDNFKLVNDRFGHAAGDRALAAVAERMTALAKGRGIVGRIGGDEFAFALVCPADVELAAEADRVTTALGDVTLGAAAQAQRLTTSIGLAWIGVPAADQNVETAMADADGLMYGAKRTGKARCVVGDARHSPDEPPPETRAPSVSARTSGAK